MILFGCAIGAIIFWAVMVTGWDMGRRHNNERWGDAVAFLGLCGLIISVSIFFAEVAL